ncbi:ribonuclease H-like domain-containing protein [Tanacetum coccineum]
MRRFINTKKEMEATVVDGHGIETTTIGGGNGQAKQEYFSSDICLPSFSLSDLVALVWCFSVVFHHVETDGSVFDLSEVLESEFRGLKRKRKPVFPKHLQERFGKLRYHAADPRDFLNYQGCEFLLISASDNIHEELGVDVHEDSSCSDLINTFGAETSTDALLKGIWELSYTLICNSDAQLLLSVVTVMHNGLPFVLCSYLILRESLLRHKTLHSPINETSACSLAPLTPEETKVDKIVLSWMLFTLSDSLRARIVVERPKSAKEAWILISDIVKDNKRSRTNTLKVELRSIKIGDQSMESYFQKIDSIVNILTSLDARVNEEDVVYYALEGHLSRSQSGALLVNRRRDEIKVSLGNLVSTLLREIVVMVIRADMFMMLMLRLSTGTLQDPSFDTWNMDTGANSHLNNSTTSLSTVLNSCMYSTVSVGDGHSIPVTNTSHSILPTPLKSLSLNNVLITPHIDFMMRRVLLRCDSTRDLYPITTPSPIPHAFLVSQHTWHQRLGHPGSDVLRRLVSNNVISCNKEKPPVLCHACQLSKHVRLPFVSSNTIVSSCFDIVHSDVWTSPIPSLLGFQYYVLFLDHYS